MRIKMHRHEYSGLLKSRHLISPFGLLQEPQMIFLASLLLKNPLALPTSLNETSSEEGKT